MNIGVIGAGPAGLTAALRLQKARHTVTVFEASDRPGGRTRSLHFGPGHHIDTGAGWLASFYDRTLALLDELGIHDSLLLPRRIRGADALLVEGAVHPLPYGDEEVEASALLTPEERRAWRAYVERLSFEQSPGLGIDRASDTRNAFDEFAPLGRGIVEYVVRPIFEGAFYSPLEELSAAMVRSWLRALDRAGFYQLEGGMDVPWLKVAAGLDVRIGEPVETVAEVKDGAVVSTAKGRYMFDGAIVATPAPIAADLLDTPAAGPTWLGRVAYAPQVRVYAARPGTPEAPVGVTVVGGRDVFTVEHFGASEGAWGACPPGWEWALICARGSASERLMGLDDRAVATGLWDEAKRVHPGLFPLASASVAHLIRWEAAVPVMEPGHFGRVAAFPQEPPVVFAGDWLVQPSIEGAVRSGEFAARVFGTA